MTSYHTYRAGMKSIGNYDPKASKNLDPTASMRASDCAMYLEEQLGKGWWQSMDAQDHFKSFAGRSLCYRCHCLFELDEEPEICKASATTTTPKKEKSSSSTSEDQVHEFNLRFDKSMRDAVAEKFGVGNAAVPKSEALAQLYKEAGMDKPKKEAAHHVVNLCTIM